MQKTGVPCEILGDKGSDLHAGIRRFCEQHEETVYIHDIKHQTALLLEKKFKPDEQWIAFKERVTQSKKRLQQTELAALAPPNQRTKSRYMNMGILVDWGKKILWLFDNTTLPTDATATFDRDKLQEKLGWILNYRDIIEQQWYPAIDMMTTVESYIRREGYHRFLSKNLCKEIDARDYPDNLGTMKEELLSFVAEGEKKATGKGTLLGSSEVIESLFGKTKNLEASQSKQGFTSLLLAIPALTTKLTKDIIHDALLSTPVKTIREWHHNNIGVSVQSSRRKIFEGYNKKEQKWHQKVALC